VDIPAEVKADLTLRFVDTLDDVVPRLFEVRSRSTNTHPRPLGKPAPSLDGAKLGGRKKQRPALEPKPTRTSGTP
jgi:ATP-dependent Lon protease